MNIFQKYKSDQRIRASDLKCIAEEDLLKLKSGIDKDIVILKNQLSNAKTEASLKQKPLDQRWYGKASFAKKMMGQTSQMIQVELSCRRKKRQRQHIDENLRTKALLEAIDLVLPVDQKEEVLLKAYELKKKYILEAGYLL